jgi:nitroimidazol reductase NimA-like FMN-containing flavoprotein (pyridoxamine 5'-phosphate oxidase superfamily)
MQLVKKLEIQSKSNIVDFLNSQPVGRVCSIDSNGFPQVIPMNFVYLDGTIYMHSHPFGEKLDNIRRNPHVGFEVDQHVCFLPSHYFHPTDASQADTLYISVVIKGAAELVHNDEEKARALNALMEKYQKEGRYEALDPGMPVVREVAIIKVIPAEMRGKYKIGQHWARPYRLKMAQKIIEREGLRAAEGILDTMGIQIQNGIPVIMKDPVL